MLHNGKMDQCCGLGVTVKCGHVCPSFTGGRWVGKRKKGETFFGIEIVFAVEENNEDSGAKGLRKAGPLPHPYEVTNTVPAGHECCATMQE